MHHSLISRRSTVQPSFLMQSGRFRQSIAPTETERQEDLYNELSKLRDFFLFEDEHRRQPTWAGLAKIVLKRSKEEHT